MEGVINLFYQWGDSFAFLLLSAIGLAIIYGMMGIINQAHGEFIMLGAYIMTILSVQYKVPLVLAILLAAVGVGLIGFVLDRIIICRLYDRPLDSIVVTWGISLMLSQGIRLLFGPSLNGVSMPKGSFSIGNLSFSLYRVLLIGISLAVVLLILFLFRKTQFGLMARATMQNKTVAQSLGVNSKRMYALTFALGAALAGLTGALYAPAMAVVPTLGSSFTMQAFVAVIVGGSNPFLGALFSSLLLGFVNSQLSLHFNTLIGKLGMLVIAIVFIRVSPQGFSGMIEKIQLRRRAMK